MGATTQVTPDQFFKREGVHVHTEIPVTLSQAILGGTISVPTLSGSEVEIKVHIFAHDVSPPCPMYHNSPLHRFLLGHNLVKSGC